MSGDGAFVHLVGGEWAEVKTLSIGEVSRTKRGEVCTQHLSYFSRLRDATRFEEAALVETHRRGLERAREVCAVQDGAQWLQGLTDYHRADAVRILDVAHAAEYINEIGQVVQAAGGRLPARWLDGVLHRLKHQGPTRVLTHLAWLAARYPSSHMQEHLTYLQKREAHMQYPTYQAAGWPIGSRQSHARAAQCRVQSTLARDMDDSASAATRVAYSASASKKPAAAGECLLVPRRVGSTRVSALSSLCCCGHRSDGCGHREAINASSRLWLFLAQTFCPSSSFHPC